MGNAMQSLYIKTIVNNEKTSTNEVIFKNNSIGNVNIHQGKKEEESVTLNWLPPANCFTGREDILEKINEELTDKKCVVLHGMPGIGKSETARQFGSRLSAYFNKNLIWIFSETSDKVEQCFKKLAASLKLEITDAFQIFNQFKESKALLVFDDAKKMAVIENYLPSDQLHPNVYVLITSHLSDWSLISPTSKILLKSLNTEDALSIFKKKLKRKFRNVKPEKWKELVQKLDGIPLCLQIVSSLIQQQVDRILLTKFDLDNFITELEENFTSLTKPVSEQHYYKISVDDAINSVLSQLKEVNAFYSIDLLCFVAYLDEDCIDDDVLLLIPSIEKSEYLLEEALEKLVNYSLIQIVNPSDSSRMKIKIKVYRTVHLVLRNYDLKKQNGEMFKTLLGLSLESDGLCLHNRSIFKYANKKVFLQKIREFYNENHKNESLIEEYVKKLVDYKCYEALQIILPEFKNSRSEKFINILFTAIDCDSDLKTIQVFFKSVAQNGEIEESSWPSTNLIDILLESNIFKNAENVSEDNVDLKNFAMGRFLHSFVLKSNKKNVKETKKCIDYLIFKWRAVILYKHNFLYNNNILHTACMNSDLSIALIIDHLFQLENGKLKEIVNCQNANKETPVHYLFRYNKNNPDIFEIFRYFICECQTDITIQNEDGQNILFNICRYGSFEMIEFIMRERDCSQMIYDQDNDGDVAFSQLIENGSIKETDRMKLIDYFLKNKKEVNRPENFNKIINKMLYEEVSHLNNNLETIKLLIENGAILEKTDDIPCRSSIEFFDILMPAITVKDKINVANTFLHSLVFKSNKENVKETIECINYLISKWDADILHQDHYLDNLLHIACMNKEISLEIIEYLFQLENGKLKRIVDRQNKKKETPLHLLLRWNKENSDLFEIFRYFITKCKANITIQDEDKRNILFNICRYGSFEMIQFILKEKDCSQIINDQDEDGDVAFSNLITWNYSIDEANQIKLFNLFLKYGMDINLKNEKNKTLLEIAEEKGLMTLKPVYSQCVVGGCSKALEN